MSSTNHPCLFMAGWGLIGAAVSSAAYKLNHIEYSWPTILAVFIVGWTAYIFAFDFHKEYKPGD